MFKSDSPIQQLLWGNVLLVGCCAFYLLWWILAFHPTGAVKGFKSGWLLIPAFVLGIAAVVQMVRGVNGAEMARSFFTVRTVVLAGVAAYVLLLLVTLLAFHRQVTTELLLIVGWTVLAFLCCNALYGTGYVSRGAAVGLLVTAVAAAVLSMVCYLLYYGLGPRTGYVDGMIPLILVIAYTLVLIVLIVRGGHAAL